MPYYNRNGEELKLDEFELSSLDSGNCGSVEYNGDIIFKQYHSYVHNAYRLKPIMFDFLKTVNNTHFIEFYEIYCKMSPEQLSKYLAGEYAFRVDAYTAKYYPDNSVNALFENKDYLLENLREIEKLFNEFADNRVMVNDLKRSNVLLGNDGIILIDPDSYSFADGKKSNIVTRNKEELLYLFQSICRSEATILVRNNFFANIHDVDRKINDFATKIRINENTDVTHEISKKLKKVRKPANYFLR